ncbi:MAG: hypothetical protein JWP62_2743 [Blastococcus sp.]|nr:hypothetical protein [Blastococcus sp.]
MGRDVQPASSLSSPAAAAGCSPASSPAAASTYRWSTTTCVPVRTLHAAVGGQPGDDAGVGVPEDPAGEDDEPDSPRARAARPVGRLGPQVPA